MKVQLLKFLNRATLFSPKQYGVIKGKNTEDSVSDFLGGMFTALNNREKVAGSFFDF